MTSVSDRREIDSLKRALRDCLRESLEIEARLAKVPALVEALKKAQTALADFGYEVGNDEAITEIWEALAAWESE